LGIEKGDKTLGRIKIGGEAGLESDYSAGDFKEGAEDVFDSIKSEDVFDSIKSEDVFDSMKSEDVFDSIKSGIKATKKKISDNLWLSAIEPRQIELSTKFALNSLTYKLDNHKKWTKD